MRTSIGLASASVALAALAAALPVPPFAAFVLGARWCSSRRALGGTGRSRAGRGGAAAGGRGPGARSSGSARALVE